MTFLLTLVLLVALFRLVRPVRLAKRSLKRRHSKLYNEYMPSGAWRKKKIEVFKHYGRACANCGSRNNLQVHHKTYKRLGRERLSDLQVLCRECHRIADMKRRRQWRWI